MLVYFYFIPFIVLNFSRNILYFCSIYLFLYSYFILIFLYTVLFFTFGFIFVWVGKKNERNEFLKVLHQFAVFSLLWCSKEIKI